jgi:hypothetical protein
MSWLRRDLRRHTGNARMIRAELKSYGNFATMMWASPTRQMVAKRPRHGGLAAMILATRGRQPGGARMMVDLRPRHGFAMIICILNHRSL